MSYPRPEMRVLTVPELARVVEAWRALSTRVVAPVRQGEGDGVVLFQEITSLTEMVPDYFISNLSPKEVFVPRFESLLRYAREELHLKLEEVPERYPDTIFLGLRPCDAASLLQMDRLFAWDYQDSFWQGRREKTTVVTFACTEHTDEYCFCTAVGGDPENTAGSDLVLYTLSGERLLADALTEKGCKLADKLPATSADQGARAEKDRLLAETRRQIPSRFDLSRVKPWLDQNFNSAFWLPNSLRCIGCGVCAFVCPTCHCFDIQDEGTTARGERRRAWDSCGFELFTLHTSGHNPRPVQSARWRQRVMHKFKYYPEKFGTISCVGCGRCGRACPVDMNLGEQLAAISHQPQAQS